MSDLYFRHTKTQRRFRVVEWDKAQGMVTLQGDHATFTQAFDKALFKRLGYVLESQSATDTE